MESNINHIFKPYKDRHIGETGILFATGPTLNSYKPIDEKAIKFGVNSIVFKKDIKLDYHFFGDRPLNHPDWIDGYDYIDETYKTDINIQRFIHVLVDGKKLDSQLNDDEVERLEGIGYEITTGDEIKKNISKYKLLNHSIVFSCLQFMLYTGIKRIYLVGCDMSNIRSFRDERALPQTMYSGNDHTSYWILFKKFIEVEYSNVEIISINPVGLKGMFKWKK